jgi:GMP synthase-like glutamine amidotransferase
MREPKRPRHIEKMLDESSTQIGLHLRSLDEAQRQFRDIVSGRSFLLVDTTLNNPSGLMERGLAKLHDRGWDELATLYLQKLFGGQLPKNTTEIFQNFLGPNIRLATRDIRESSTPESAGISAVLFSGSPANVSDALKNPQNEVRPGITHGQVYQRSVELYQEAARRGLPVIGICYGHQMVTEARGGNIVRDEKTKVVGMQPAEPTGYGAELLAGTIGAPPPSGEVAAFHGEVVQPGPQSAIILRTSDRDPELIYGAMHVAEGSFSGEAEDDASLVNNLFEDSKHVALTVQGHPEYTGPERLITFAAMEDARLFEKTHGRVVTADMLSLFGKFLEHHGNFKK